MAGPSSHPSLCIITPTFRRERLLRRFLGRMRRQTDPHWRLIVSHDGPDGPAEALVARYSAKDPRIEYIQSGARANDTGVTPRVNAIRHALGSGEAPDYCVLWDDDNAFVPDALREIARALEAGGRPDLLVVSIRRHNEVLPPPGVPISAIVTGQIDTGCLVIRTRLALEAFEDIQRRKAEDPALSTYVADYLAFDYIRRLIPPPRIHRAEGLVVGLHDGLRWMPYLRHRLRLPPLDLANRPWVRALTLGLLKPRHPGRD